MDEENLYITTVAQPLVNNTVKSLMCINIWKWDINVIRDILNERDQSCILNILIQESNSDDTLYWSKENTGLYSMRNAYKLLQAHKVIGAMMTIQFYGFGYGK